MAAKPDRSNDSKKRKRAPGTKGVEKSSQKKVKLPEDPPKKASNKHFTSSKQRDGAKPQFEKTDREKKPENKREQRLRAKELAEARKKKRKRHYTLEQELASLWERMRCRDIPKEDRSKLASEALSKMKGKMGEIAGYHVSSRVLQTCVKYCTQDERGAVFEELRPHFLTLASNAYAVHLVTKMLDSASKEQLAEFISSLYGHVASLLRHMVGSVVVEHAYQLGNASQKQSLLMEMYSAELQLFKDLVAMKESRLVDIISKLKLQKPSVLRHMASAIQPILEKGILDHSIVHRVIVEYFSIADQSSAADVVQQLSGPLLVRMIHTKDGAKIGILCMNHGSAKERKKIIKGMKGQIEKIAHDKCGSMVLVSLLLIVDDTKLITKIVIRELQANLKDLVLDKIGRRPLLQLLHPNCPRYFSPDDLASLSSSIPSLCLKGDSEINSNPGDGLYVNTDGGKKDPSIRREELLVKSGLAESLVDVCCEKAGELLKSNFGKEVIYEVATGGSDGILHPALDEKLGALFETISSLVAQPKSEDPNDEHLLENFHSSRIIRKLVLDCPAFASALWEKALKDKCTMWVQGHSCKVISAFLETSNAAVQELAKEELQPFIDNGVLKLPVIKDLAKSS